MKNIFTLLLISSVSLSFAQSPMLVNYQGVARDASGTPIANQAISLKFEILQGSSSGSAIYTENQTGISTSSLGIFSTQIGKSASLSQVNWQGGPYYLQVSMDPVGGSNMIILGAQQLVSVPFAMHAETVPSTYTNNVLTIGSQTHAISSGTAITVSGTGTNVTVSSGPNYTISYTPQQLAISGGSIGLVGGNSVALPLSLTPTLVPSGIATVTNGASSYTVGVPAPSYNMSSGVLTMGSANTLVTPTLGLTSSGVLYSGVFTNSVAIPSGVTVSGTGLASVTGAPNYIVNVAQPTLALSANNLSISIVGSNSVALPAAVTLAQAANNIITVNSGPGAYTVGLANPIWTGTALILGASNTVLAPSLGFNSGILSVSGSTLDLNGFGPFTQAGSSVTLTTATDNVAIGLNAATAKLDVYSNATSGSVIKANNANSTNTTAAVDVSSSGAESLYVTNTSAGGVAGDFSATGGNAVNAQNSSTFPTILAQNSNTAGVAGHFIGGLTAAGSSTAITDFTFKLFNSASANLFAVRNDGFIGIGHTLPITNLDINGNLRIGTSGSGKLFLGAMGGVNSGYTGLYENSGGMTFAVFQSAAAATTFGPGGNSIDAMTIQGSTGYVGLGTTNPAAALHIDLQSSATRPGIHISNALDYVGGALPFIIDGNTSTLVYGSTTFGRLMRLTNSANSAYGYDFGIDAAGSLFLTKLNVYGNSTYFTLSNAGNIGIGNSTPAAKLDVAGTVKITDGSEADGKILTSNASGLASWKSSPAATSFGSLNNSAVTVGTSPTTLGTSSMVFTKQYTSTEVNISLHSLMLSGTFAGGASVIFFQIYVDGSAGSAAATHVIQTSNKIENISLESYFSGLSTGSHTITIIGYTDAGTSSGVTVDPGGYQGRVLVKETF